MKWNFVFVFLLIWSCQKKSDKVGKSSVSSEPINQVAESSMSSLTFPLDFPVRDLYQVVNAALPAVLVEDTLKLKKKGKLFIKIEPIGRAMLASYGNNLDVSIPMKVTAVYGKKVMGLKVNKATDLKVRADMNTKLSIGEDWNLQASCRIKKIHWIEPPKIEVLGIKVNLQKFVDRKLKEQSDVIEEKVCNAVQKLVPLKAQVTKIWDLMSKPHRVAKKPVEVWLTSNPSLFSAHISRDILDTLRVLIHTQTELFITPLGGIEYKKKPIPANKNLLMEKDQGLNLLVDVYLPYEKVNEILNAKLGQAKLNYEGASLQLANFETNKARNKLHLKFDVSGDLEATIDAYAFPELGKDKSLLIQRIEYDIKSDNQLVKLAKWVARDQLTELIQSHATVPLAHVLDSLDEKIVMALNKSKVGGKVALDLQFNELRSDTLVFSDLGMQWYFEVKGQAHSYLTEELIQ